MRSDEVNLRRGQFTRVREAIPFAGGEVVLGTEQALEFEIAFTFGVFAYTRCSIHNGYADVFLLVRQTVSSKKRAVIAPASSKDNL